MTGDQLPPQSNLDYVFSIGVLHHIQEPAPVVQAAFEALRPGGRFFVWVYGKEGNEIYLAFLRPIRILTKRLPHSLLSALVESIYWPLMLYTKLCRIFPLSLGGYLLSVFDKMPPDKRRLIIYDQLNPSYAKYYTGFEAERLLLDGKFKDVFVHHRHGYSWSMIGTKPRP
jgi:SAM-dependent methyltransferase